MYISKLIIKEILLKSITGYNSITVNGAIGMFISEVDGFKPMDDINLVQLRSHNSYCLGYIDSIIVYIDPIMKFTDLSIYDSVSNKIIDLYTQGITTEDLI